MCSLVWEGTNELQGGRMRGFGGCCAFVVEIVGICAPLRSPIGEHGECGV